MSLSLNFFQTESDDPKFSDPYPIVLGADGTMKEINTHPRKKIDYISTEVQQGVKGEKDDDSHISAMYKKVKSIKPNIKEQKSTSFSSFFNNDEESDKGGFKILMKSEGFKPEHNEENNNNIIKKNILTENKVTETANSAISQTTNSASNILNVVKIKVVELFTPQTAEENVYLSEKDRFDQNNFIGEDKMHGYEPLTQKKPEYIPLKNPRKFPENQPQPQPQPSVVVVVQENKVFEEKKEEKPLIPINEVVNSIPNGLSNVSNKFKDSTNQFQEKSAETVTSVTGKMFQLVGDSVNKTKEGIKSTGKGIQSTSVSLSQTVKRGSETSLELIKTSSKVIGTGAVVLVGGVVVGTAYVATEGASKIGTATKSVSSTVASTTQTLVSEAGGVVENSVQKFVQNNDDDSELILPNSGYIKIGEEVDKPVFQPKSFHPNQEVVKTIISSGLQNENQRLQEKQKQNAEKLEQQFVEKKQIEEK